MFCFQCQECARNTGCTVQGVCGKKESTAILQDLLLYILKGIGIWGMMANELEVLEDQDGQIMAEGLFATITNANWDDDRFVQMIGEALIHRDTLKNRTLKAYRERYGRDFDKVVHDAATWIPSDQESFFSKAQEVGVLSTKDEDVRSLREMLIIGLKGIAAYTDHASILGYRDHSIELFFMEAMASTTEDRTTDDMVRLIMKAGEVAVTSMALLDRANTETYGHPEITSVNLGVRSNPAILISGHDLRDLEELLKQTEGTGVDVYTHGEMLPAHYYPFFKQYDHFVGNYGNAWWQQNDEFEAFNGAILMTTNCLVPLRSKDTYGDRLFTTGMTGYPGIIHIPDRKGDKPKDFSDVIAKAKGCPPPTELETGSIVGGFAHNQVMALADKVVEAVTSGAIKRFIVMAGCDGRHKSRAYYTDVAVALPQDTVILTAGCAKYRYNKLNLGDIGGIPRVLDAGQCNDSYSLAMIALKLKEIFGLNDINDLPISYDIAWYEQKAVAVLLALLFLGVKNIRLGPTLPGFLSPNVAKLLVETFEIKGIETVESDVSAIMVG
ncbi:MAG: hydroxylamine reductase [Dethiosulfovibrio peptidovorans]|nr:MAG: hydroxylamine reductase [Dethiosulfovibrio peptidovorans]